MAELEMAELAGLPPMAFKKQDPSPDLLFYAQPRFVTHMDDVAIGAVTSLYRELFPAGGTVLDLMSSWVSHLPAEVAYAGVIGHGMNAAELAANPRLTQHFVRDLNTDPQLPVADAACDAAAICAGMQYLERPVSVLREVARVLRPGAPLAITFANRCFPTKAVAIWQALAMPQQAQLLQRYLAEAKFGRSEARVLADGRGGDPLMAVLGWAAP